MESSAAGGLAGLPPEDRRRSPYTGWTRAHWERVADSLLDGARRYASPGHALVQLPGPRPSSVGPENDAVEGFARTFLLAALRLAGSEGAAPGDLVARYSEGLATGTDPRSGEAWPRIEATGQPMVEAAIVAVSLSLSRPWVWDRLPDDVQARVVDWLAGTHGKQYLLNNWLLFQVVVNAFLKSVGAPYLQAEIDRNLDVVDSWYRSDGWYSDGPGHSFDYYVGWSLHFYTLLWCLIDGDRSDPERAATYRNRLRRFLDQYRFLIAADGAPVYQGRSLIYRMAVAAPVWLGALVGATPLSAGETRRLASGVLRHFVEHGSIDDGVLTLGWHREFAPMAQPYSGPGSPYWGSKGFLGLALPPDHAVWTATEEPLAVERSDYDVVMPAPGFVVRGTRSDGVVRLVNHGSDHFPLGAADWSPDVTWIGGQASLFRRATARLRRRPRRRQLVGDVHYRKLAYSSHAAPDVSPDGVDSELVLESPNGSRRVRKRIHTVALVDRFAASVFFPGEPSPDERVETVTIGRGAAEVRVHHVISAGGATVIDGGFALAGATPPRATTGEGWSAVWRDDGLASVVVALHGYMASGIERRENANAFGRCSATPTLESSPVRVESVHVSLVLLTRVATDPEEIRRSVERVEVTGRRVVVEFRDGECFLVQLVAPEPLDQHLGGVRVSGRLRLARVSPDGTVFTSSV